MATAHQLSLPEAVIHQRNSPAALAERNLTGAVLAGLAAAGGAIVFFHKVIGPDTHLR